MRRQLARMVGPEPAPGHGIEGPEEGVLLVLAWRERWAKGRYPGLSAQATQQIIAEFVEAVDATRHLWKNGHDEARYPWKRPRYRDVVYTNQDARIKGNRLVLPNGSSGTLRIIVDP